jgi:hypothetical protein
LIFVFEAVNTRQKQAKRGGLWVINDRFKLAFNTAVATQIENHQSAGWRIYSSLLVLVNRLALLRRCALATEPAKGIVTKATPRANANLLFSTYQCRRAYWYCQILNPFILNTPKHSQQGEIRQDPSIQRFLARMSVEQAESFSDEQLFSIRNALGARNWGHHKVDWRGTLAIPLVPWRAYFVILAGRNRRRLSVREQHISALMLAALATLFLVFCVLLGLVFLYLVKSALGIDLLPHFSLGIWSWFQAEFLLDA